MASQDNISKIKGTIAVNPATVTTNTTTAGVIIDTQGFESVTFFPFVGARTNGTVTPLIEAGDASNLSDAVAVVDADLLPTGTGQEASVAISTANTTKKIGYRGAKRYVRMGLVTTATSGDGLLVGGLVILSDASEAPVA